MGRAFEFRKARKLKRWSAMAKTFTRLGKDIVISVKKGGPDPNYNSSLRAVIQNAKAVNMPKENIERAIKKASDKTTENFKEVLFEGYAPHGIAILIETTTLIKVLVAAVSLVITSSAPVDLEFETLEYVIC